MAADTATLETMADPETELPAGRSRAKKIRNADSTAAPDVPPKCNAATTPDASSSLASTPRAAPAADCEITPYSIIEAVLLATDDPLTAAALAEITAVGDVGQVKAAIAALNQRYEAEGASFRIESIAKGYQILTLPAYDQFIHKLNKARAESRLSPAALETLAIVAYKQPVLRADIEAVRGVAVGDMLVRLRDMNLVRIVGRAEEVGRPLLYGTTTRFLEIFGLGSLKDLPKIEDDQPGSIPQLRVIE